MTYSAINITNSIVTNNSVVMKNFRPLEGSIVNKKTLAKYQKPKFLLKYILPTFHFSKKNFPYILITNEWSTNYYHWIYEALPRLVFFQNLHPHFMLILPKSYLKIDFVTKSLQAFKIDKKSIVTIQGKSHLKVNNLFFINTGVFLNSEELKKIKETLISNLDLNIKLNFGDKIYISRGNPKINTKRKVENESEILPILEKYGFKILYMEDYSFIEQISIARSAKYIIAPHGAGIANSLFINQDGVVLELVNKNMIKSCYESSSEIIGLKYFRQNCEPKNQSNDIHMTDIMVEPNLLEKNIQSILKS